MVPARPAAALLACAVLLASVLTLAAAQPARARTPVDDAADRQNDTGERLRWALLERDRHGLPPRYAALDAVIADLDRLQQELATSAASAGGDRPTWVRVRGRAAADLLTALFERGRNAEVVARADAFAQEGLPLPFYAHAATAGAYARLRQPDRAVLFYERTLTEGGDAVPMPSDVHVGLVYALIDTGRIAEARTLADRMVAATPPTLRLSPEAGRPNPEYGDVLALRALVDLERGHSAAAERRFGELSARAPLNLGYLIGWSRALRDQAQPQRALAVLEARAKAGEEGIALRAAYGEALLAGGRIGEGRAVIEALPDESAATAVRPARRALQEATQARLEVDLSHARDGGTLASDESALSVRLLGPRSDSGLRGFVRTWTARAKVDNAGIADSRSGVGVEWLQPKLRLTTELNVATWAGRKAGAAVQAIWRPRDAWQLEARWDGNTTEVPWRARRAGIAGALWEAQGTFFDGEQRFTAGVTRVSLTDGNARDGLRVSWRRVWPAGDRTQLTSTVSVEGGRFRNASPFYFSPAHEAAADAELSAQWLGWRYDDAQMHHIATVHAGRYWQDGFGAGAMLGASYAHEWDWNAGWNLRYGLALNRRPYDGTPERRSELFLQLGMPLR